MHRAEASNGSAIASNWLLSTDGTKGLEWRPESSGTVSYASNSNDVGNPSAAGASTLVSRADHVHRGVRTVTSNGSNGLFGDVNLQAGTGIALGVAGQSITVTNTGVPGPPGTGGGGGSGALVFLEAHTASASSSLDFTTFISGTYDDYEFHLINIQPATDGANLQVRMGTGGGPTFDTGANYSSTSSEWQAAGGAVGGVESGATSIALTRNGVSSSSHVTLNGRINLYNPAATALYKVINGTWSVFGSGVRISGTVGGDYNSDTAVTAIRFLFSSGNIAAGIIRVYGVSPS